MTPGYPIEIPEEASRFLSADASSEVRMAAAVKLFELGRLSSGTACILAGVSRIEFLQRLSEYGVESFRGAPEDLEALEDELLG